jgi:ATP-dependent DNA helicase RecG
VGDLAKIPVTSIDGVGGQLAARLDRLRIRSVQDLLFHLPLRYQDRTRAAPVGGLRLSQHALVIGRIEHTAVTYGRRRALLTRISDGTGALTIRLFHFSQAQQRNLRRGRWLQCFGEVRPGPATLEMIHPEYRVTDRPARPDPSAGLTPVYPITEGLTQARLRRIIDAALADHLGSVVELLPKKILLSLGYPALREALSYLHHPPATVSPEQLATGQEPVQQRLAFEELLAHHLSLRLLRERRQRLRAPVLAGDAACRAAEDFMAQVGFQPTAAQRRVVSEIGRDLERDVPMLRLVQGDVGSGKTLVAAASAVRAAATAHQTAVMAPTELLAEQHWRTFSGWLEPMQINVGWLSGQLPARERRAAQAALAAGDKGQLGDHVPHQLIMTATPIPRTLAMTFYADLDVSSIDQLPPGRRPVDTVVVPESRRPEVVARVAAACADGRQAYWVCPLIDESEALDVQAATAIADALSLALPDHAVGLVHGRMRGTEKERAMQRFRNGEIDVLVATTVIEVGVDVPNASLMIIENSERLGLSQLHQLRGRVGRGAVESVCVLLYHPPLGATAQFRLAALRETSDGFEIARRDLELRGPGELLGTRQTGLQRMRVADLARDRALLPKIQAVGQRMMRGHRGAVTALVDRWVGGGEDYSNV